MTIDEFNVEYGKLSDQIDQKRLEIKTKEVEIQQLAAQMDAITGEMLESLPEAEYVSLY